MEPGTPSEDEANWTWPPSAPPDTSDTERFRTDRWAPPSSVRRPWIRIGRWVLLYRRGS